MTTVPENGTNRHKWPGVQNLLSVTAEAAGEGGRATLPRQHRCLNSRTCCAACHMWQGTLTVAQGAVEVRDLGVVQCAHAAAQDGVVSLRRGNSVDINIGAYTTRSVRVLEHKKAKLERPELDTAT